MFVNIEEMVMKVADINGFYMVECSRVVYQYACFYLTLSKRLKRVLLI